MKSLCSKAINDYTHSKGLEANESTLPGFRPHTKNAGISIKEQQSGTEGKIRVLQFVSHFVPFLFQ
jgi:hypothetical protein